MSGVVGRRGINLLQYRSIRSICGNVNGNGVGLSKDSMVHVAMFKCHLTLASEVNW